MSKRGYTEQYRPSHELVSKDEAKSVVANYISSTRNPNLKLGEIKDTGNAFEVGIVTKDESLVDKVLVDNSSGAMRSTY